MILSATQLNLAAQMIERTGYVRIVFESQDPNTLAVTARIDGRVFEISDLGLFQFTRGQKILVIPATARPEWIYSQA